MGDESDTTGSDIQGHSEPDAMTDPTQPAATPAQPRSGRTALIVVGVVLALLAIAGIWWLQGGATVPDVTGLSQEEAAAGLVTAGLAVGKTTSEPTLDVAPGTVTAQSPAAGTSVREGASVDLTVATLPTATVPDVVGKTGSQAEADLAVAGLRVGEVDGVYTTEEPAGTVMAQSPEGSTEAQVGSAVALEVSAGPKDGAVPDVIGLASVDANDVLVTAGFEVKETSKTDADVAAGVVITQSPAAGTVAQEGTTVTITVSTGAPAEEAAPPADTGGQTEEPAAPEPPATPETPPVEKPTPKPEPSLTEVPDLIGMRVLESLNALRQADLQFSIEWGPTDDNVLRIIEQDPAAGATVDRGTVVNLTIGLPSFLFDGVQVQPLPTPPPDDTGGSGSPSGAVEPTQ